MKRVHYSLLAVALIMMLAACNNSNVDFKRAKSGMLYKIFPAGNKDSLAKIGNIVKLHYVQKLDDSVMNTTYGKAPYYIPVEADNPNNAYNPTEILTLLKKGDSAVTVVLTDTLFARGLMQKGTPPFKEHQRITISFKVVDVFRDEQTATKDKAAEDEKDRPRMEKEREEQMAKMKALMMDDKAKAENEAVQSGMAASQAQEIQTYLTSKNINATKTGKGTFVHIDNPGSGPQVENGKYILVKYRGTVFPTDSVFQENQYEFKIGQAEVVAGWDEGLLLFKQGGKGKLYIPGFLGYGNNPPPQSGFKPQQPLAFDVEVLSVSPTPTNTQK